MTNMELFALLGEVDETLLVPRRKKRRPYLAAAACLCLALLGGGYSAVRLGYFAAGCGAYPGEIVEGAYYYYRAHDGVYRYDGESEKVLGTWWMDEWSVNEYGVYYARGRTFGVVPHGTGKRQVLYRASWWEADFVRHELREDGSVYLKLYEKGEGVRETLLLNGITGEVLEEGLSETAADTHFTLGPREFTLVPQGYDYDLVENGVSCLPEGTWIQPYSVEYTFGDCQGVMLQGKGIDYGMKMLFLRPEGGDTLLTIPQGHHYQTGSRDYLLDVQYDGEGYAVWCLDSRSGDAWELGVGEGPTVYSLESDGDIAYATAPWDDYQSLWKVETDAAGRPTALALLDSDIMN